MREVSILHRDPGQLASVIGEVRQREFMARVAEPAVRLMAGRSVVNVSSTAAGGGVAEMLRVLLGYARGVDIDARWFVVEGDPGFFAITKRVHNHLYGLAGDDGPLGRREHERYERAMRDNLAALAAVVRPGDVVILHDPQTAGLAGDIKARGAAVVWRCHVGIETQNERSREGWEFLRRYLDPAVVDAYVFTLPEFAPDWVPADRLLVIPPGIDPFSPKNCLLTDVEAVRILATVGVLSGSGRDPVTFRHGDGSPGRIERGCDVIRAGPPPTADVPLVTQVSRWDRAKDMAGVMAGFAETVLTDHHSHLALVGPSVSGVADDPEGAQVLGECFAAWRELPIVARERIQLVCVSMHDLDENAMTVNALQRHSTVVVQKSLAEGFGLTVAEAMFKGTPVLGSRVGGIATQIRDGVDGILLDDPSDLHGFGTALAGMLDDVPGLEAMGRAARERAIERFLPDRQLAQWVTLLERLGHTG